MQGKRSWFAVRSALVEAIESKEQRGVPKRYLYIPEVFDEAKRNDIASRRIRSLSPIMGLARAARS